ncbi:MAG: M3 family oligoendopeptidase, partial [Armatimonadetes bacterium]|nr:M3 family oligoendopeptidase [Armatimonadota bacterium]
MAAAIDPRKTFPRRFVPSDADAGRWEDIERLGHALLARRAASPADLEQWLVDRSEFAAWINQERTRQYIAMTSQTDDPERERAYLAFVQKIEPRCKPLMHRLDLAHLKSPHRGCLPARYAVLERRVENRAALYQEENVPLEVSESEAKLRYQKIMGAMTVHYRGEERTIQQMAAFLEDPLRATREEAWRLSVQRRLQDVAALRDLFDHLRGIRMEIARNAGFASYRDYIFRRHERFDYGPEHCLQFHDAVEAHFVPLAERLNEERRALLGVSTLRPWDLEVDPLGHPPLRPFARAEELADRTEAILRRVSPEFGGWFRFMRDQGLLDVESRKGKAPGGYQEDLTEARWPFIFMNAVGLDRDLRTILHESGHAVHALAVRE